MLYSPQSISLLLCAVLILLLFSGCTSSGKESLLDPTNPVTLTLRHNFGGQIQTILDSLVETFNGIVGAEAM